MTELEFTDQITVKLIRALASDDMVVQAAQVSSKGENNPDTVPGRLIEALMAGGHGSPFEHNSFTFFVEAPLFVFREWQRHRISSFNEMSGRYTELPGRFYLPNGRRKMRNVGTKMKPQMVEAPLETYLALNHDFRGVCHSAWRAYQIALSNGVSNEVARMVLPLNIMSQMYWTVNARSMMNFLSLRREMEESVRKSYPQWEIQLGAEQVEQAFAEYMPITQRVFHESGRVAP